MLLSLLSVLVKMTIPYNKSISSKYLKYFESYNTYKLSSDEDVTRNQLLKYICNRIHPLFKT